jgi:large subunit ribosomal protein L10e
LKFCNFYLWFTFNVLLSGKRATFQYRVQLSLNEKLQIRHMAIESTRLAANKTLEKTTGETGYYSRLRIYPHILLRENKQIATAGADRISEGMRRSWGKATSLGARVKQGQCIMELFVNGDDHLAAAKKALKGSCVKLPGTPTITVVEWNKPSP